MTSCSPTASTSGDTNGTSPSASATPNPDDPANWSDKKIAARLILAGVDMGSLSEAKAWAKDGIGGLVVFGTPPNSLRKQLASVRAQAPGKRLLISSDEEGGLVQRLTPLLGSLPSAADMGSASSEAEVTAIAKKYGAGMKHLGVNVDLAPVADLAVPGKYINADHRAFADNPEDVARYVVAWNNGMAASGVLAVVKHWPGHGSASNTHVGSGVTPPWSTMQLKDAAAFKAAIAGGLKAVMVGHLQVPGLTESGTPASQSPEAMRELRTVAGPQVLIMTDSLTMGAVTSAMHQSEKRAAIRAIAAGSDMALVESADPVPLIKSIAAAIASGKISREQAVESARRVVAAQDQWL